MLRRLRPHPLLIATAFALATAASSCSVDPSRPIGVAPDTLPRLRIVVGTQNVEVGVRVLPGFRFEVTDSAGAPYNAALAVNAYAFDTPGALAGRLSVPVVDGVAVFDSLIALQAGPIPVTFRTSPFSVELRYTLQASPPADVVADSSVVVIQNVTVVPMDGSAPEANRVVVLSDKRITAIGAPGEISIPANALRIDGTGRWLAPGLIDFHSHERAPGNWPDDYRGNALMYLANGITTIVNMGEFTASMVLERDRVANGEYISPRIFVGHFARAAAEGAAVGQLAGNADEGRAVVAYAVANKYDFIKVYSLMPLEAFDAIVASASAAGLPVIGHGNANVGLQYAITHGQSMIVHGMDVMGFMLPTSPSPAQISSVAAQIKASGAAVSPTLAVTELIRLYGLDVLAGGDPFARMLAMPGRQYMADATQQPWRAMLQFRTDILSPVDRSARTAPLRALTRALVDAGVPVIAGTDGIGIPGMVPGFSMADELNELQAAGLTNAEVLHAATSVPGEFLRTHMNTGAPLGVVRVGALADLVLLDRNPLEDRRGYTQPVMMFTAGRAISGARLRASLDSLIAAR